MIEDYKSILIIAHSEYNKVDMTKKKKTVIIIVSSIVGAISLAVAVPFLVLTIRSAAIRTNYGYLKDDATYSIKVEVSGFELVEQKISCGYASIEMMSTYYGNKVTEQELSDRNGGAIVTSTTDGFYKEIKKTVPNKVFVKKDYQQNAELLKNIHGALSNNNPVAMEWAAKYENEWTLHFSVVTGLDIGNDVVTVYNPYGYIENISVGEFISRTTFEAYTNLPFFLAFGFAYGAFTKNTIFYAI